MKKLLMLKGLPASGKSTWAKDFVLSQTANAWKRICKDDLRSMLDGSRWSSGSEKLILEARDLLITAAFNHGSNVIVDDTNFHSKHEARLRQLAKENKAEFEIKMFDVSLEECIERDSKRPNPVGEKVIREMWEKYLRPAPKEVVELEGAPNVIICDLDGTLCLLNGRDPYDASTCQNDLLNKPVARILEQFSLISKVIFVSGRKEMFRYHTEFWLEKQGFKYEYLFMRRDDDDRKDAIVKQEIFDEYIRDKFNVLFVLDDRNQVVEMWRSLGLTCLQVADGDF